MKTKANKSLYVVRPMPEAVRKSCMEHELRLEDQKWEAIDADEVQWFEQVHGIAIRPMLSEAIATMASGDLREGLYGLAVAFGFAADQQRRSSAARVVYRRLSNACDRMSLRAARFGRTSSQEHMASA